jgi:hypothetical protein
VCIDVHFVLKNAIIIYFCSNFSFIWFNQNPHKNVNRHQNRDRTRTRTTSSVSFAKTARKRPCCFLVGICAFVVHVVSTRHLINALYVEHTLKAPWTFSHEQFQHGLSHPMSFCQTIELSKLDKRQFQLTDFFEHLSMGVIFFNPLAV